MARPWHHAVLPFLLALLFLLSSAELGRAGDPAAGSRPGAVILAVNDVYRIAGVADR